MRVVVLLLILPLLFSVTPALAEPGFSWARIPPEASATGLAAHKAGSGVFSHRNVHRYPPE